VAAVSGASPSSALVDAPSRSLIQRTLGADARFVEHMRVNPRKSLLRPALLRLRGFCGIGASPFVFHIVIAPSDSDSYLSEIYLESMKGRLFRMEPCTVADGNVTLHFRSNDGFSYWIAGDGYGDAKLRNSGP
jgi:hypothetical protein